MKSKWIEFIVAIFFCWLLLSTLDVVCHNLSDAPTYAFWNMWLLFMGH